MSEFHVFIGSVIILIIAGLALVYKLADEMWNDWSDYHNQADKRRSKKPVDSALNTIKESGSLIIRAAEAMNK